MCQNHQDILFIAMVNTNLIKQRNQCKIFYNLFNLITAQVSNKKKKKVISN